MLPANTGVWIIKNPAGTFSYVGSLPTILGDVVLATTADVMAGRATMNPNDGKIYTLKFPVFPTASAAREYALDRGVTTRITASA